jgi:DNA-binding transcriptional LysR family regulator
MTTHTHLIRTFRLRHIEMLTLLAHEATLRVVASKMSLTQPAVSKMIRQVEDSFGTTLFDRRGRLVVPNDRGRELIRRAVALSNEIHEIGEQLTAMERSASSILRIGTFSVLPRVPTAIARLRQEAPQILVRVREGTAIDLTDALIAQELDCIVGALPPELLQTDLINALKVEPLADDQLCIVASSRHALTRRKRLSWAGLVDAQWVLPPRESLLRRAVSAAHLTAGLRDPDPAVELLSPISIAALLEGDSTLVGAMRLEHARFEGMRGTLKTLPVHPVMALPPLSIITRYKRPRQGDSLRKFINVLQRL